MIEKSPNGLLATDMNMKSIILCFVSGTKASWKTSPHLATLLKVRVQDSHSSVYFPSVGSRSPCQGPVLPPIQLQQLPVLDNPGQEVLVTNYLCTCGFTGTRALKRNQNKNYKMQDLNLR